MKLKPVVSRFIENLILDLFPQTPAELVDFGFDVIPKESRQKLYWCYQYSIKRGKVTPLELDEAVGDGPKLTVLLQRVDPNMVVKTMWDLLNED